MQKDVLKEQDLTEQKHTKPKASQETDCGQTSIHLNVRQRKPRQKASRKLYGACYLLGVFLIRGQEQLWGRTSRVMEHAAKKLHRFTRLYLARPAKLAWRGLKKLVFEFTDPFSTAVDDTITVWHRMREDHRKATREEQKTCLKSCGRAVSSLLNHLLPIVGVVALLFVVGRAAQIDYAIEITYQGQVLGFVDDELTFQKAKSMMLERTVFESSDLFDDTDNADHVAAATQTAQNGQTLTGGSDENDSSNGIATAVGRTIVEDAASPRTAAQVSVVGVASRAAGNLSASAGGSALTQIATDSGSISKESANTADSSGNTSGQDLTKAQKVTGEVKAGFRLVSVNTVSMDDADSLCDKLIRSLGDKITEATGLYVDDVFYGSVKDGTALDNALQQMLEKADDGTGTVSFYRDVALKEGLYPTDTVVSQEKMDQLLTGKVAGKKTYTIASGDAPYSIASKFDVPYAEFKSMNPNIETTCLVGQVVTIAKEESFLPILITKQVSYTRDVAYDTQTKTSSHYYTGYSYVSTKGVKGADQVTATVSYLDGEEVKREIIKTVRVKDPVTQVVTKGTKTQSYSSPYQSGSSSGAVNPGGFAWPTASHGISCGWWGYWGHNGIDITGKPGTPVYASAAGTVTWAGWRAGGFGYYVQIDHGNGFVTGYMHNSFVSVRVGQKVSQGQQIAGMGATGNAYGSHCHFEMYYNGRYVNPTRYLP